MSYNETNHNDSNHNEVTDHVIRLLNQELVPINIKEPSDYQWLLDKIGDCRLVLLGEATHGTQEFYHARMELSKLLISQKQFHAIAIEGDLTSAHYIHRFLQEKDNNLDPIPALSDFKRFPTWMWRNQTIVSLLKWLKEYNIQTPQEHPKVGFYGLDLYCLHDSMNAVIQYLEQNDPDSAEIAKQRYACFEHCDAQDYGYLVNSRLQKSCVREVIEQYLEMQNNTFNKIHHDYIDKNDKDLHFFANQNARLVKNAENYYRSMFSSRASTWNIRDQHMAETLQNIMAHLESKYQEPAKVIIWAHNSHIGDARATEMGEREELNLGQIVREQFSATSYHIGFSTYTGTVTAADNWGMDPKTKQVVPGLVGSYESLFHKLQSPNFQLDLHHHKELNHLLNPSRLQRAIGVVYRPDTERESHYFFTHLPYQFDTIIHLDSTTAVLPID